MKKVIAIAIVAVLLYALMPVPLVFASSGFAGGAGTAGDPYLISTPEQMDAVRSSMTSCFKLTQDIDLSLFRSKNWLPIGSSTNPFTGTFDGNGKSIKNLVIDRADTTYVGLFGYVNLCTIKDVTLGSVSIKGGTYTGGLVGYANGGTLSGGKVTGLVNATPGSNNIQWYAGGVAGYANNAVIENSSSKCDVTSPASGGLVGDLAGGTVHDCDADGNITTSYCNAGGLIGIMKDGEVYNCNSKGHVTGMTAIGGFIGLMQDGSIKNSQSECAVDLEGDYGGGFIGQGMGGAIKDCVSSGSVNRDVPTMTADPAFAGFIGNANEPGLSISDCHTTCSVEGYGIAGGFAASVGNFIGASGTGNSDFDNCYSEGLVDIKGAESWAGGFLAYGNATMNNCYSISDVNCIGVTGGFAAYQNAKSKLSNCFWLNHTSSTGIGMGSATGLYRIGDVNNGYVPTGSTVKLQFVTIDRPITFSIVSSDHPSILSVVDSGTVAGVSSGIANISVNVKIDINEYSISDEINVGTDFDGGSGTVADPYKIATPQQLTYVTNYENACYRLENDIDLSGIENWNPIGTAAKPFMGGFDGAGHKISGMTIDHTMDYAGLFGYGLNTNIKNTNIVDAYITVGKYSGGLIGYMDGGSISNCLASGQITTTTSQNVYSGMLVGYMTSGTLANCYAIGDVTSYYAGVFAGYMGGTMTNCYWYNSEADMGIAQGTGTNLKKVDLNISSLFSGQEVNDSSTQKAEESSLAVIIPLTTNFNLYGKPGKIEFAKSSKPVVVSIANGHLKALAAGTSIITTKFTYLNGKIVLIDYKCVVSPAYMVTFNSQGGSAVPGILTARNTTIQKPASPTRAGYTFAGWYKEAACTHAWNFSTDKATGNITLFAKWTVDAPTGVKAVSASYISVKITWNGSASGFEIWRMASGASSYSFAGTTTSASFTNTGLATGQKYYYKVRAYRWSGSSKVYSPWSIITYATPVPTAPAVKAVPATYSSIKLSWNAVAGATKYLVYRSSSKAGTYSLLITTSTLNYTNTGVNTGSVYYYKVRAYRLVGSTKVYGDPSAIVSAKASLASPASVKAVRASSRSIKVSWGAVAGATKYEIWRASPSTGKYALVATVSSTYFTNTSLTTGKTYYYKVKAYRLVGSTKVYGGFSIIVSMKP